MARPKKSIMGHFPYNTARVQQRELLEIIEKRKDDFDVFAIVAPTACGKSAISLTLAKYLSNTSIVTPTNVLVQQYIAEFPELPKLFRKDMYVCEKFGQGGIIFDEETKDYTGKEFRLDCKAAHQKFGKKLGCDKDCEYKLDLRRARNKYIGIYNNYTYMAHKLFRRNIISDEAHTLLPTIQELESKKLWKHKYHFPRHIWTYGDLTGWIEQYSWDHPNDETIGELANDLRSPVPKYVVERTWEEFNGEMEELIKLTPVDVRDAMPYFWPSPRVQKIFLLSATISEVEVEALGLDRRRVLYIEVDSPIEADRRQVIIPPNIPNLSYRNIESGTENVCKIIVDEILPKHRGESGIIHTTYKQKTIMEHTLSTMGVPFMTHGKEDAIAQYKSFLKAPVGTIFLASGLETGIDLKYDRARWQVIAKVPWLSLADPAIKYIAEKDEKKYLWDTLKKVMQAAGRVCRAPDDKGTTYILDGTVNRLLKNAEGHGIVATWFLNAIRRESISP